MRYVEEHLCATSIHISPAFSCAWTLHGLCGQERSLPDPCRNATCARACASADCRGGLGIDPTACPVRSNYAVDFVGNKIVNTQTGPFTVTSAAQVTIANTTFVNVLCVNNDTQVATLPQ
jgi:hypothetical protein